MINSIMNYIYTLMILAIIVAVLDMILPKGNSKKYVRLVSGIILTYIAISPIISILSNVTGTKDSIVNELNSIEQQYSSNKKVIGQEQYILNLFEEGVKKDLKKRVEQCGYVIDNLDIRYELNKDNEITKITYIGFNVIERINETATDSSIKNVSISVNLSNEVKREDTSIELTEEEKKKIIEYIGQVYQVDTSIVHIV